MLIGAEHLCLFMFHILGFPERLFSKPKGHYQAENHQQPNSLRPSLTDQETEAHSTLPSLSYKSINLVIRSLGVFTFPGQPHTAGAMLFPLTAGTPVPGTKPATRWVLHRHLITKRSYQGKGMKVSGAPPAAPHGPGTAAARAQACGDRTALAPLLRVPATCGRAWGLSPATSSHHPVCE